MGLVLYWGNWVGPQAQSIKQLTQADFTLLHNSQENPVTRTVSLPHFWGFDEHRTESIGVYRIRLPAGIADVPLALIMSDGSPDIEITYAGKPIPLEELTGRLNRAILAKLGRAIPGESIEIRVRHNFALRGGLDDIRIGPEQLIERQAWIISSVRYLGRAGAIVLPTVLGILAFGAYWFRAMPLLLSLSFAALAYAFQQGWIDLLGYWKKDDFQLALFLFLSVNVVFSFSLSLLQVTKQKLETFIGMALIFLPLIGLALFTQSGSLELRRIFTSAAMIICFSYAVFRSGRELVRLRSWFLISLAVIIGLRLVFSVSSIILNHGLFSFATQNRQMLLSSLAMLMMLLIFARGLEKSFRNFQITNEELREEISTYKKNLAAAAEQEAKFRAEHAAAMERDYWLREIHDGLGSHLIAARFLTDKVSENQDVLNAKESIDDCIEQLRVLVESLSPEPSSIPSLIGAMRYRMMARLHSAGLDFRWDVDPMIEATETSPIVALHVQRIVAEAISNILKHAHATIIRIHIFSQENKIVIRIEDNGKGFDKATVARGRGIANMKTRAKKCQGEIFWTSMEPGTRVQLSVPNRTPA